MAEGSAGAVRETRSVFGAGGLADAVAGEGDVVDGAAVDELVVVDASAVVTGADLGGADVVTGGRVVEVVDGCV